MRLATYKISSGGNRQADKTGKMVQSQDQDTSSVAQCFQRNIEVRWPVAVIAGKRISNALQCILATP